MRRLVELCQRDFQLDEALKWTDEWKRLKTCRDEHCRVAFYDKSRNRSRAWCSMEVCGNREKARSFRQRHATKTA